MTHLRFTTGFILAAGFTAILAGTPMNHDDLTLPARLRCTVMVLNTQPPGTMRTEIGGDAVGIGSGHQSTGNSATMAITIDRWSTEDEHAALDQALKSGGVTALVTKMEKMTVGHLQVNADLRLPIQVASTWMGQEGRVVRLATNSPILRPASASRTLATDAPIGIVEFTFPPSGGGEGSLVAATRVAFDDDGRILALSLAMSTGTQRLTNVETAEHAGDGAQD